MKYATPFQNSKILDLCGQNRYGYVKVRYKQSYLIDSFLGLILNPNIEEDAFFAVKIGISTHRRRK